MRKLSLIHKLTFLFISRSRIWFELWIFEVDWENDKDTTGWLLTVILEHITGKNGTGYWEFGGKRGTQLLRCTSTYWKRKILTSVAIHELTIGLCLANQFCEINQPIRMLMRLPLSLKVVFMPNLTYLCVINGYMYFLFHGEIFSYLLEYFGSHYQYP